MVWREEVAMQVMMAMIQTTEMAMTAATESMLDWNLRWVVWMRCWRIQMWTTVAVETTMSLMLLLLTDC